ncbi:MAG: CDP-diacylglycerol--glycerol-3-phosphate 3-phosphatidyltransferase [Firmicutes bacterium]|nr:CDP-diacylglycerol--glycerol-3-phosphate 3-phosphatidyltransferase [Bacillota bacterium]
MNTPNKLTVLRILMTPIFMVTLIVDFPQHYLVALALFIAASVTDLIDGKIARKYNMITDMGKFLDPLADKMLTTAAFLSFMALDIGWGMLWINFIVLTREFLVTSVRYMAASSGKVVAANIYGKIKTVSQMTAIIMAMAFEYFMSFGILPPVVCTVMVVLYNIALWFSVVMTVVSGVIYVKENREFIGI